MSFSSYLTKCDVRTLKLHKPFLFVGTANTIHVLNCYPNDFNKILITEKVFENITVNGLTIGKQENGLIVGVYGNRFFTIYELLANSHNEKPIKLCRLTKARNFHDWIIEVNIVENIAFIVRAHNEVVVYDWKSDTVVHTCCGVNRCILYSSKLLFASVSPDCKFVLASGTVFKEIVIWTANASPKSISVCLETLVGHDGVIFAINFNEELNLLVSASDDRSVRIWTALNARLSFSHSFEYWQQNKFNLSHIFYGHESRIWSVDIITKPKPIILSVGEDSALCFWDINENKLIEKEKSYKNSSIWCLAVDKELLRAYTGGSDSCIMSWDIENILTPITSLINYSLDPKAISIIKSDIQSIFVSLNSGDFLLLPISCNENTISVDYSKTNLITNLSIDRDIFKTYCALDVNDERNKLLLGSKCGHIAVIDFKCSHECHDIVIKKLHNGKVFSVLFICSDKFISCGNEGIVKLWKLKSLDQLSECQLPSSRHRWSSAALLYKNLLVIGDRSGSIFAFVLGNYNPIDSYRNLHGRNGVTSIQMKPNTNLMYTCGRNGKIFEFLLDDNKCIKLRTLRIFTDMEWISKVVFDKTSDDLIYVLGFEGRNFVIWNELEQRFICAIDCGGGHRSWDLIFSEQLIYFTFIKQEKLICLQKLLSVPKVVSNRFLFISKPSHSKKINCCVTLYDNFSIKHLYYFATAGEDNNIHINCLNVKTNDIDIELIISGHISNISAMSSCCTDVNNICYLVSVGGRSQLMLWKFFTRDNKLLCQQIANNFLWSNNQQKPRKDSLTDAQSRYLDVHMSKVLENIFISTACSDCVIRLFLYDSNKCHLDLLRVTSINNICILRIMNIFNYSSIISASNDGILKLWSFDVSHTDLNCLDFVELSLHCRLEIRKHQSGINSLDVHSINENYFIIACGGDDNKLSLSLFFNNDNKLKCLSVVEEENIHFSQITAIKFLSNNVLVSSSIDQQIVAWKWKFTLDKAKITDLKFTPIAKYISSVADISSLCKIHDLDSNEWKLMVCGEGFEILKFTSECEESESHEQSETKSE